MFPVGETASPPAHFAPTKIDKVRTTESEHASVLLPRSAVPAKTETEGLERGCGPASKRGAAPSRDHHR